jgi:hypothetical protein
MREITFTRRLLVTAMGAGLGVLGILFADAADRSADVNSGGIAIFVAVALTAALVGAALTRRVVSAMMAAILAALAVPATYVLLIATACSSGICD